MNDMDKLMGLLAKKSSSIKVGQIKTGYGTVVDGRCYRAQYAGDIERADGKTVFCVVENGKCVVWSDK